MSRILTQGFLALALVIGTAAVSAAAPEAGSKQGFAFSAQPNQMKVGVPSTFTVQVSSPSNAPVSGAKITATRLDMGPDGMAEMTAPIKPVNSGGGGGQAFSATLPMAGHWAVSLEAKVPGEVGPVRGQVVLEAK
ncbi:MAG: FixH family protein [Sphingomonadales bacterium]